MVTAVTGIDKPKKKPQPLEEGLEQGEDRHDEEVGEQHPKDPIDKCLPGVSFWIAIRTHSCMLPTLERSFVNLFHSVGLTIYDCKVNISVLRFHFQFSSCSIHKCSFSN